MLLRGSTGCGGPWEAGRILRLQSHCMELFLAMDGEVFSITNHSALYTTQTVSVQVQDVISTIITNPPILAVPGNQIVVAYSTIAFRVLASGSTSSQVVRLSAFSLPTNSTFTPATGNFVSETFSWTPTQSQVGAYTVGFVATVTRNY